MKLDPRSWFRDPEDNTRDELLWRVILTSTILIPLALFVYGLSEGFGWMLAAVVWLTVAAYMSYRHIRHANAQADAPDRPQPPVR